MITPPCGSQQSSLVQKELLRPSSPVKVQRIVFIYLLLLVTAAAAILGVLHLGAQLQAPGVAVAAKAAEHPSALAATLASLGEKGADPVSRLFLQLLVILAFSRLMGMIFSRLGQPSVVGEMAAGILLGPSLFGLLAPQAFDFVFAASSLGTLKMMSQVGVCLFMFSVGMELDAGHVRGKAHSSLLVSHCSILFPYLLGVGTAYFAYTSLAQPGATFMAFALFMGISMAITAFPVLARILQDRGIFKTSLGSTAITCAALGDVTAWIVLAFVVAIVRATNVAASALNLLLVAVFVALMLYVVRPLLPRVLGKARLEAAELSKGVLALMFCVVIGAALCTEIIGIHALFGAFLAGAIMPETDGFRHKLALRLENFSTVLLLPLFFVFTGLRTQVGLLNDAAGWMVCVAIIAVATFGKLAGTAVPARLTGMPWRESLQLGALMNTRGLMELIALNIGYDLGILSPRIFTMLVIMALVTTMLTGPLLGLFGQRQVRVAQG